MHTTTIKAKPMFSPVRIKHSCIGARLPNKKMVSALENLELLF